MRPFRPSHEVPPPRSARARRSIRALTLTAALTLILSSSCKGKEGALSPPRGADPWDAAHALYFDDGLTELPIRLEGRAPNDVRDQKRFGIRFGSAALVVLVKVSQTWTRGLQGQRQTPFIEIELGRVLMGKLPPRTAKEQTLEIRRGSELPDDLQGKTMILFLRWVPGGQPSFRHHLLLATDELVTTISAMVQHAKRAGQLGSTAERRRARRARSRAHQQEGGSAGEASGEGAPAPEDSAASEEDLSASASGEKEGAVDAKSSSGVKGAAKSATKTSGDALGTTENARENSADGASPNKPRP
jgi:hypothetical protein